MVVICRNDHDLLLPAVDLVYRLLASRPRQKNTRTCFITCPIWCRSHHPTIKIGAISEIG